MRTHARQVFWLLLFPALFMPGALVSEEVKDDEAAELINCALYRAKLRRVPVYKEPSTAALVLDYLELGEKVCHIGEQNGFAIIDWAFQNKVGKRQRKGIGSSELVFVRLVDLWEPRDNRGIREYGVQGVIERVKQYYRYLRSGGVPEGGLLPLESARELAGTSQSMSSADSEGLMQSGDSASARPTEK